MQWRLLWLRVLAFSLTPWAGADFLWGHVQEVREEGAAADGAPSWGDRGFSARGRDELVRRTRALVFPDTGVYKLVIGLGVPVPLPDPDKMLALGVNFQFQYATPNNASQIWYPSVVRGRGARHHRTAFYNSIEATLDRRGVPGRICLLRAICEAALTPLLHNGLLGEILHMILTPSLGHAPTELLSEYRAAEEAGAAGEDCVQRFGDCPPGAGLLDHISYLRPLDDEDEEDHDLWRRPPPHWNALLDPSTPGSH